MKKAVFLLATLAGCNAGGESANSMPGAASSATGAPENAPAPGRVSASRTGRVELPRLAEDAVRVPLIVVPGDAPVEVDGVPVRRRNGAVELVGRVGEVRRVRAFRGSTPGEEKLVTIEEKGTTPALIDANEVKAAPRVKAKPKPVRFNLDE